MKSPTLQPILNWQKRENVLRKYSVHLRVTLFRKARYIPIDIPEKVSEKDWSGKVDAWVLPTHPYAFEINNRIKEIKSKIEELVKRFYLNRRQITFKDIWRHIMLKGDCEIFNQYVSEYIRLRPDKLEIATWEKYITFSNHLNEFNPTIHFTNLTPDLVTDFKRFLEKEKGFVGSTVKVYFDKFQKVVKHAEKAGYFDRNYTEVLFDEIGIKVNKPKRVFLEAEEIRKLKNLTFTDSQDDKARERDRDLFLFQIYTGCYYNDLRAMKKNQLVNDDQYGLFILGERDKNGNDTIVPLFKFPNAADILNKYRDTDPRYENLFPPSVFVESQVYNRTLKKIAKKAGITKDISGKTARHTNAQLWVRYGAEKPVLSKMLGHNKEETTNHYYSINIPEIVEGTKRADFLKLAI